MKSENLLVALSAIVTLLAPVIRLLSSHALKEGVVVPPRQAGPEVSSDEGKKRLKVSESSKQGSGLVVLKMFAWVMLLLFFVQDVTHIAEGIGPRVGTNVLDGGLSLAGFQVIINGRFWVITEAVESSAYKPNKSELATIRKGEAAIACGQCQTEGRPVQSIVPSTATSR